MKSINHTLAICILSSMFILLGCEREIDLTPFEEKQKAGTGQSLGDTSYVEIIPPFTGFESPKAVLVGNDQIIYVADNVANEVVMLDASGRILRRRSIPHPVALAQNSKLDLYVAAEVPDPNSNGFIGAVYRISLVRFDTTYVSRIDTIINPSTGDTSVNIVRRDTSIFYNHELEDAPMRVVWMEAGRPSRRFTGIGILPGNGYVVTRTGPDNSSFVDPDARLLLFDKNDNFITPIGDLVTRPSGGTAITDIRDLTGIMVIPSSRDFILSQNSDGVAYGAIWMIYQNTPDFQGWVPKYDPAKAEQRAVDFIRPYRFRNAAAATYDKRRREIFVVDSQLDSVFKFDRNGNFKSESFGRARTSSSGFPHGLTQPGGIAFSNDCTLYIADTGNKVVRRFRLSTQTTCN